MKTILNGRPKAVVCWYRKTAVAVDLCWKNAHYSAFSPNSAAKVSTLIGFFTRSLNFSEKSSPVEVFPKPDGGNLWLKKAAVAVESLLLPENPLPVSAQPLVLMFALFLLPMACSQRKEQLVQQTVQQRVEEFRKKEIAKCRAELVTEAGRLVDSLLLHEALEEVQDSLHRLRPLKPIVPHAIPPIDSLHIQPIFDGHSR